MTISMKIPEYCDRYRFEWSATEIATFIAGIIRVEHDLFKYFFYYGIFM